MSSSASCSYYSLMLLLLCSSAAAEGKREEPVRREVVVSVERRDSDFQVDASVMLPVRPCEAYALLTDYASLPDYIPGMVEIGVERLSGTTVKIRQVGKARIWFFSIRVELLLEMEETPNRLIVFKLIEGDLEAYSGEWRLQEAPEGTRLTFSAALIFDQYVPAFLGRSILEDEVSQRFDAVVKEAEARKGRVYPGCAAEASALGNAT